MIVDECVEIRAVWRPFKNLGFLGFFKKPKNPKNQDLGF